MRLSTQIILSFIVGFILILVVLVLSIVIKCPTPSQYNVFRIIIAIAVAAFATMIPGNFQFKFKGIVSAVGGIGVFAFVYLYDPAKLVVTPCATFSAISGTVYINNKETKNVDVRVNQLKTSAVTDEYGSFKIEYPIESDRSSFNFRIIYSTSLDTSFSFSSKNWENLSFNFDVDKNNIAVNPVQKPSSKGAIQTPILIQKKQIQNYFLGELPESSTASYGGDQYCRYSMKYTDIKIQLKLSADRKSVQLAKVTFKANEKANPECPYQSVPPNTHIYDLSNANISEKNIFVSFNPDHSNNPLCSLTLVGTIENSKIIATLTSQRIDMPDPKLVFTIKMDLQMDLSDD